MLEKRDTSTNFLHELKDACAWLNIEQGRATDYRRLLDEFDKGDDLTSISSRITKVAK